MAESVNFDWLKDIIAWEAPAPGNRNTWNVRRFLKSQCGADFEFHCLFAVDQGQLPRGGGTVAYE